MLPVAIFLTITSISSIWLSVAAGALMPLCYIAGLGIGEISKVQGKSQFAEWLIGIAIGGVLWYIKH